MLGGPERAGVKGLGDTPSAGRAAAPGQFQVETLGRGRSADRVAYVLAERAKPGGSCGHGEAARASARARPFQAMARAVFFAFAVVSLFVGPAAAEIFVGSGAQGTIEFPLENDTASGEAAAGVQVTPRVEPASMADRIQFDGIAVKEVAGAVLPISIAVGQTRTLVVSYTIKAAAQDGDSFQVFLDADLPDQVVDPDPATWDTSVRFIGGESLFLVGAQLRPVFQSEPFGGLKLSVERLPYRQAGRQAFRAGIRENDLKAQILEAGLGAAFSVEESLAARKAHNLEVSGRFLRRAATNLVAFPSSGALPRAWLPRKDSNPQPASYLKVSAYGVLEETRTHNLMGHSLTGLSAEQFSCLSRREMARSLVAWLRQERLSSPYVLDRFEKEVVERLPDVRSLSLACAVVVVVVARAEGAQDRGDHEGQLAPSAAGGSARFHFQGPSSRRSSL